VPGSWALELSAGPSVAWKLNPHWTLLAFMDTGLPLSGLGHNRSLLTSASVGIRHAHF
jgi:hypothetical protein